VSRDVFADAPMAEVGCHVQRPFGAVGVAGDVSRVRASPC
jgi:hypothetical protein